MGLRRSVKKIWKDFFKVAFKHLLPMFFVLINLCFLCNVSALAAWYLHIIESICSQVRELACTSKFTSYAGSSLAAGRATVSDRF
jgi:hypothetical protein